MAEHVIKDVNRKEYFLHSPWLLGLPEDLLGLIEVILSLVFLEPLMYVANCDRKSFEVGSRLDPPLPDRIITAVRLFGSLKSVSMNVLCEVLLW